MTIPAAVEEEGVENIEQGKRKKQVEQEAKAKNTPPNQVEKMAKKVKETEVAVEQEVVLMVMIEAPVEAGEAKQMPVRLQSERNAQQPKFPRAVFPRITKDVPTLRNWAISILSCPRMTVVAVKLLKTTTKPQIARIPIRPWIFPQPIVWPSAVYKIRHIEPLPRPAIDCEAQGEMESTIQVTLWILSFRLAPVLIFRPAV